MGFRLAKRANVRFLLLLGACLSCCNQGASALSGEHSQCLVFCELKQFAATERRLVQVEPGQFCQMHGAVCTGDYVCNDVTGSCQLELDIAGDCSIQFSFCKEGILCIDDICQQQLDAGQDCTAPNTVCYHGWDCHNGTTAVPFTTMHSLSY